MSTTTSEANAQRQAGGIRFGVAALFLVGFVALASQIIATFIFGIADRISWELCGPGALAVTSAIFMSLKCRSWDQWKKWNWLPLLTSVVLAFVFIGFIGQSIASEDAAMLQEQKAALLEEQEAFRACQILWQKVEAKSNEIDDRAQLSPASKGRVG